MPGLNGGGAPSVRRSRARSPLYTQYVVAIYPSAVVRCLRTAVHPSYTVSRTVCPSVPLSVCLYVCPSLCPSVFVSCNQVMLQIVLAADAVVCSRQRAPKHATPVHAVTISCIYTVASRLLIYTRARSLGCIRLTIPQYSRRKRFFYIHDVAP